MRGEHHLPGQENLVTQSWHWESCTWVPFTWPFILSQALWAPIQKEGAGATRGTGRSWLAGVLPGGITGAILGEAPGHAVLIFLDPGPTQTKRDSDRDFTVTSGSLSSAPELNLDFIGGGCLLRALLRLPKWVSTPWGDVGQMSTEGSWGAGILSCAQLSSRPHLGLGRAWSPAGFQEPRSSSQLPLRAGMDDPVLCVWCEVEDISQGFHGLSLGRCL